METTATATNPHGFEIIAEYAAAPHDVVIVARKGRLTVFEARTSLFSSDRFASVVASKRYDVADISPQSLTGKAFAWARTQCEALAGIALKGEDLTEPAPAAETEAARITLTGDQYEALTDCIATTGTEAFGKVGKSFAEVVDIKAAILAVNWAKSERCSQLRAAGKRESTPPLSSISRKLVALHTAVAA